MQVHRPYIHQGESNATQAIALSAIPGQVPDLELKNWLGHYSPRRWHMQKESPSYTAPSEPLKASSAIPAEPQISLGKKIKRKKEKKIICTMPCIVHICCFMPWNFGVWLPEYMVYNPGSSLILELNSIHFQPLTQCLTHNRHQYGFLNKWLISV